MFCSLPFSLSAPQLLVLGREEAHVKPQTGGRPQQIREIQTGQVLSSSPLHRAETAARQLQGERVWDGSLTRVCLHSSKGILRFPAALKGPERGGGKTSTPRRAGHRRKRLSMTLQTRRADVTGGISHRSWQMPRGRSPGAS